MLDLNRKKAKEDIIKEFGTVSRMCKQYDLDAQVFRDWLIGRKKRLSEREQQKLSQALRHGLQPIAWKTTRSKFLSIIDGRRGGVGFRGLAKELGLSSATVARVLSENYYNTESKAFQKIYAHAQKAVSENSKNVIA